MRISPLKSEVMVCEGQVPVRSGTVIVNTPLEQVNASRIGDVTFHTERNSSKVHK